MLPVQIDARHRARAAADAGACKVKGVGRRQGQGRLIHMSHIVSKVRWHKEPKMNRTLITLFGYSTSSFKCQCFKSCHAFFNIDFSVMVGYYRYFRIVIPALPARAHDCNDRRRTNARVVANARWRCDSAADGASRSWSCRKT